MQHLQDLEKWRPIGSGEMVVFDRSHRRKVRLNVNAPQPTAFYIHTDKEAKFLARVDGLDIIEFVVEGKFEISANNEVNIYTSEWEKTSFENVSESLVRIMQRKARNPELEEMMYFMQKNLETRLAQQAAELERKYGNASKPVAAKSTAKPAAKSDDSGKGAAGDAPASGTDDNNAGAKPAVPAAAGTGGEASGG